MQLLFIRHADPDYINDSLTETGRCEAAALADYLNSQEIDEIFISPMGRAQETAAYTLSIRNQDGETLDWLQEFHAVDPSSGKPVILWDRLPGIWTADPRNYDPVDWLHLPELERLHVPELHQNVISAFDALLSAHGYLRDGKIYLAKEPNRRTLAFFCHFGLECVLLAHLLSVSPVILWHGLCAAPSSITRVATEERVSGTASFRALSFGECPHLALRGRLPSFSARFCETFDCTDERH